MQIRTYTRERIHMEALQWSAHNYCIINRCNVCVYIALSAVHIKQIKRKRKKMRSSNARDTYTLYPPTCTYSGASMRSHARVVLHKQSKHIHADWWRMHTYISHAHPIFITRWKNCFALNWMSIWWKFQSHKRTNMQRNAFSDAFRLDPAGVRLRPISFRSFWLYQNKLQTVKYKWTGEYVFNAGRTRNKIKFLQNHLN